DQGGGGLDQLVGEVLVLELALDDEAAPGGVVEEREGAAGLDQLGGEDLLEAADGGRGGLAGLDLDRAGAEHVDGLEGEVAVEVGGELRLGADRAANAGLGAGAGRV